MRWLSSRRRPSAEDLFTAKRTKWHCSILAAIVFGLGLAVVGMVVLSTSREEGAGLGGLLFLAGLVVVASPFIYEVARLNSSFRKSEKGRDE